MADNVIDVLVAVDAKTLVATNRPGKDETAQVSHKDRLFLMAGEPHVVDNQGTRELNVGARTGSVVRWHPTTLSQGVDEQMLITGFVPQEDKQLMRRPEPVAPLIRQIYEGTDSPDGAQSQIVRMPFWQTTLLAPGSELYTVFFKLIDQTGAVLGTWCFSTRLTVEQG